jgi:hypothetical protein
MKDIREEAIEALAEAFINCIDETGQLPTMRDVEYWLDEEFGFSDETQDLLISMFRRVVK